MTDDDVILAGELVLGVLEPNVAAEARARADRDPAFAAEVSAWEVRLGPILSEVQGQTPSAAVWAGVAARLPVSAQQRAGWWNSLGFWRGATAAATAAAAVLAVAVMAPRAPAPASTPAPAEAELHMASTRMQSPAGQVMFVVVLDEAHQRVIVTPIGEGGGAGHDHELWLVPEGGAPVSLGLMPRTGGGAMTVKAPVQARSTLAVSVEPEGGSPTGLPTGPVVAQGQLQPV